MTTNTNPTKLTPRLNARLSAYATLAGVALTAPALAPDAHAVIVYSGPVNINIPTTTSGIYLNLVTGVSNATPANVTGWDFNPWGTGNLFLYGATAANGVITNYAGGSSLTLADNLPVGALIDGTATFGNNAVEQTGVTAFALNSSANYVGFRFLNEATNQVDYGWAQLSLSTSYVAQPRSIVSYAYENTGAAITAGVVPEPATNTMLLGAMAAGAVGVRRWRRQQRGA